MICLTTNLPIDQSARSCTYKNSLASVCVCVCVCVWGGGGSYDSTGSHIWADFQTWNLKLGHWPKYQRLHIYFFPCQGVEIELFSLYGYGFWDTCQFSKLPYLGMKLGHWLTCPKLQICSISLHNGVEIELIFTLRRGVSEMLDNF